MFYNRTFTFKTRRKTKLLAFLLIIVSQTNVASSPIPCPKDCSCYASMRGISTSCANVFWNSTTYPNIHELVMRPARPGDECDIPEDAPKVFPHLLMLNLSNCSLNYILSDRFKNLESIDTIDLSNNNLRDFSPTIFSRNRKLRYVNLQNNPLNLTSSPFLESNSLFELNLDSCCIEKIPRDMFKGVPELKFLTLSNNKIRYLKDNSLPDKLKTLNLANNSISNVPTSELNRLSLLTEINLSGNPINCTCPLMGYQNWVSGKGVIFVNVIKCAYPAKYAGLSMLDIPQYELCDAKVENEPASSEQCLPNQICSNLITISGQDLFMADQADQTTSKHDDAEETFQNDEVIPVNREDDEQDDLVGSGDGSDENTEIPDTGLPSSSTSAPTSEASSSTTTGVEKYNNELAGSTLPMNHATENGNDNTTAGDAESTTPVVVPNSSVDNSDLRPTEANSAINNETSESVETVASSEPTPSTELVASISPQAVDNESPISSTETIVSSSSQAAENETPPPPSEETVSSTSQAAENETPVVPAVSSTSQATENETPVVPAVSSTSQATENETPVVPTVSSTSQAAENETPLASAGNETPAVIPAENSTPENADSTSEKVFTDSSNAAIDSNSLQPTPSGNSHLQAKWKNDSKKAEIFNYIIPILAVLLVVLICLAVYCSQYASKTKNWKQDDRNDEGSELQEVSLLPDKSLPTIVKHSEKYPDDKGSGQTERLMDDSKELMNGDSREVNANDDQHSTETIDCCKLPNGQSENQNVPEKVERTTVKVTTLPGSVLRTPIIRNI